jgi:hypothetical protein
MRFGQNISGRISGNDISGRWNVDWIIMDAASGNDIADMETTAQFTGSR